MTRASPIHFPFMISKWDRSRTEREADETNSFYRWRRHSRDYSRRGAGGAGAADGQAGPRVFRLSGGHIHRGADRGGGRGRVPASRILGIYTTRANEIFTRPPNIVADAKRLVDGYMYDPANIRKVLVSNWGGGQLDLERFAHPGAAHRQGHRHARVVLRPGQSQEPANHRQSGAGGLRGGQRRGSHVLLSVDRARRRPAGGHGGWRRRGRRKPGLPSRGGAFYYDDFTPADTRVVSLGTGYFPPGNKVPPGLIGWLEWTVNALLDAPEDQQTEIVNRHFPGILKRFDWQLPKPIDMADTGSIQELEHFGNQVAAGMDWPAILG